jgi:rhodanese-related sulfurtransferase
MKNKELGVFAAFILAGLSTVVIIGYLVVRDSSKCKSYDECALQTGTAVTPSPTLSQKLSQISPDEAQNLLATKEVSVLDIRTPEEFAAGHLDGARNLDFYNSNFQSEIAKLDKAKTYLIYCRSGNRSGQAVSLFKNAGFKELYDLRGGISAWQSANLQVVQ